MGSLLNYTPPSKDIQVDDKFSITVRGLNMQDVAMIMLRHGETLNNLYDETIAPWIAWAKENDESGGGATPAADSDKDLPDDLKSKTPAPKMPKSAEKVIKSRVSKVAVKTAIAPAPPTIGSVIKAMVGTAPEAIGDIIAISNDNICKESCRIAKLLPAPIQGECLMAIFGMTFKSDKSGKKWYEVLEEKMNQVRDLNPVTNPPSPTP